jgi:hypothetical protein
LDPTDAPLPHEIQINLGASYILNAFQYVARQDGCDAGWISQYEFYVSADGVNWGSPVASGNFNYGTLSTGCPGAGVPGVMQIAFPPTTGQYVRLQALSEINGGPWTAAAEIRVMGSAAGTQNNSVAQVTLNPPAVIGGNSAQGTVTLTNPAPFGGLQVALSSSDPSATVPASVTVAAGNNSATFNITTSAVVNSTTSTISASYNGGAAQTATLFVNSGTLLSQAGWSVAFVDSQETVRENGAAVNTIDGNNNTKWVTQWSPASAPLPHEIQINLGASHTLTAFQYLARQDGCANGWIKQYQFYVSTDGVNWGSPVASGTFSYGNLSTACPGGGVPPGIQVAFPPVAGQYIRLRALSEINGGPWTAVAEFDVLGR